MKVAPISSNMHTIETILWRIIVVQNSHNQTSAKKPVGDTLSRQIKQELLSSKYLLNSNKRTLKRCRSFLLPLFTFHDLWIVFKGFMHSWACVLHKNGQQIIFVM